MSDDDRTVQMYFTVTTDYLLDTDFADACLVMGVTKKTLNKILAGDEDYEPSDTAVKRLTRAAYPTAEDFTVDEICES